MTSVERYPANRARWFALLIVLLPWTLSGCSHGLLSDGALGLTLMSKQEEQALGAKSHPVVLAKHGGAYRDAALEAHLNDLIHRLGKHSIRPDMDYRVTILNTPSINAFALPGGYIYVTRGMLAFANDEAELAGVLAHELAHIAARHAAKRHTQIVKTKLLNGVLGGFVGSGLGGHAFQVDAAKRIASYSRAQEYEADKLGIKTTASAGINPLGAASFLRNLAEHKRFTAEKSNRDYDPARIASSATHPALFDRVSKVRAQARKLSRDRRALPRNRARYLDLIANLPYGGRPEEGVIAKNVFLHPELGFAFSVPETFELYNTKRVVLAYGPAGSVIFFDAARLTGNISLKDYLLQKFARGAALTQIRRRDIAGMPVVTGRLQHRGFNLRFGVIHFGADRVYRFLYATQSPIEGDNPDPFDMTLMSFRRLTPAETRRIKPKRIAVVTIARKRNIDEFAKRMAVASRHEEQFRILNGLISGATLLPGDKVKIVTE